MRAIRLYINGSALYVINTSDGSSALQKESAQVNTTWLAINKASNEVDVQMSTQENRLFSIDDLENEWVYPMI